VQDDVRYFKLILEYDGTDFHGWQIQPDQRTVQGHLIEALKTITQSEVTVHGASRTDSGVHAYGQVAKATLQTRIPAIKLRAALNGVLPKDVAVRAAEEVTEDFHPRFHAIGKHYRYLLNNQSCPSPLRRRISWHRHQKLDVFLMNEGAQVLTGCHDFASFTPSRQERKTVRTIMDLAVTAVGSEGCKSDGLISVDVTGDGFLWNMVRTIVGTLVELGRGRMSVGQLKDVLAAKDRREAGPTAPPQGLSLVEIFYDRSPKAVNPQSRIPVIVA
jgi:tRNA pseudouridine38-40 synthase